VRYWQLEESNTVGIKHVNVKNCTNCDLGYHLVFLTQLFGNFIRLGLTFLTKIYMFLKLTIEILLYIFLYCIPLTGLVT